MGIFNFFKNSASSVDEFLKLNLNDLLQKAVFVKRNETETGEFISLEYEAGLNTTIFDAFDMVRINLGWEEKEIRRDPSHSIMVTFLSKYGISFAKASKIVNAFAKFCYVVDDNWTNIDEMRITQGIWRGRMFKLPSGQTVFIQLTEHDGITLDILGYERFL